VERVPQGGVRLPLLPANGKRSVWHSSRIGGLCSELACDNIEIEAILRLKELAKQARKLLSRLGE